MLFHVKSQVDRRLYDQTGQKWMSSNANAVIVFHGVHSVAGNHGDEVWDVQDGVKRKEKDGWMKNLDGNKQINNRD